MANRVAILCDYLARHQPNLEYEYCWPKHAPVGFKETYEKRCKSSIEFLEASDVRRKEIALEIVSKWGGIRRGLGEVEIMAMESIGDLTKRGFKRVASWSKVAVLHDPEKYFIYDARVAFALNVILKQGGAKETFFPQAASRNVRIVNALNACADGNSQIFLPKALFYQTYLELVNEAACKSALPAWQIEMTLFARAPELAEEQI